MTTAVDGQVGALRYGAVNRMEKFAEANAQNVGQDSTAIIGGCENDMQSPRLGSTDVEVRTWERDFVGAKNTTKRTIAWR